jgi:hypothetical protein
MQCDKKSLLVAADASNKRNLMAVGGHADNFVDLCGEDSADGKRQYLGKGQTMLTKPPSQAEFQECWSEVIIKCGLSPSVVDDLLFRKALVTTARMGQSAVWMGTLHSGVDSRTCRSALLRWYERHRTAHFQGACLVRVQGLWCHVLSVCV